MYKEEFERKQTKMQAPFPDDVCIFFIFCTADSTGRYVTGITDALGNTTEYNYNTANGLLNYVLDANDTKTSYLYDLSHRITDVFTDLDFDNVIDDNESSVSYEYDSADRLSKIITTSTTYNFVYDYFGNVDTITVGDSETPLVTYVYGLRNGKPMHMIYANGDYIGYEYDVLDRVEKLCYNGAVRYVVTYAKDGTVSQIDDLSENITYKYEYDRLVRLLTYHEIRNGQIITSFTNHYDSVGRNDKTSYKNEGYSERTYENTYSNTGYLMRTEFAGNDVYVSKGLYFRVLYHVHKYNGQARYNLNIDYKFFTNADGESRSANQITALRYTGTGINLTYNYIYDTLGAYSFSLNKARVKKFSEKLWVALMMKKCCCFCGKEIKEFPQYVLTVQKSNQDEASETPLQDLFCHEDCLVKRLFDDKWLYIKYT